ncbi:MAG: diaminopimelate epimerase [Granulosicoccus sp.]|nr:diaminopimelate epimerase [Granulosicoccus sp.]
MHGLGNDFMLIDNLDGSASLDPGQIQLLADRHTGVGFDQLLLVNQPSHSSVEFDYQIFNADGTEVEHCGNGARCFAQFVFEQGLTNNKRIKVNTLSGPISLELQQDGAVMVEMGVPQFAPEKVPFIADKEADFYDLDVAGRSLSVGVASIGNPHVLLQVDDLQTAEVEQLGSLLEQHQRFPNRVNVSFMQRHDHQHISLRVFERGVGETRACGSAACASVAIAHRQGLLDKTATVSLPGGELHIHWPNRHLPIEMTGPCSTVFEGQTRM